MKKNINLEFIRIIAMIMVVILHILGRGGFLENAGILTVKYNMLWGLEVFAYVAVNMFAMITGYIYITKKTVRFKNLISIWSQVLFYSVIILSITFVFLPTQISGKEIIKSICPIIFNQYWYVTAYFGMYMFIPYINIFIKAISNEEFKKILCLLIAIFSIIPTIINIDIFGTKIGYSMSWLIVMYFIGAFIKLNEEKVRELKKKNTFILYIGCLSVILIFKFTIEFITSELFGKAILGNHLISYTSIFVVIASISLFISILNININQTISKYISYIGPLSFGVYLIHTNPLIFNLVWPKLFINFVNFGTMNSIFVIICSTIIVFTICIIIEKIRLSLFKILKVNENIESFVIKILNNKMKFRNIFNKHQKI